MNYLTRSSGASAALFFLVVVGQLPAQTADIGYLTLTGSNFGYQTVDLYNLTGLPNGCGQLYAGSPYNVCNGVDISSWQLEIEFTPNVAGLPSSPLIFDSSGSGDSIGPVDANFDDPYGGEADNPWSLSFDLVNAGCSPTCDAQISAIILTGTLDTSALQLYNGGGPTILDSLPSTSFSETWNVPSSDYTDPVSGANVIDSIYDSSDIIINNNVQAPPSSTPEPGSVCLLLAGAIGIGFLKRASFARS